MEVEATGDAVDVEDFASEIEMGHMAAFEGREVDGLQRHAATCDKLIFEGGTAGNLENIVLQDVNQSVNVFFYLFLPSVWPPAAPRTSAANTSTDAAANRKENRLRAAYAHCVTVVPQ